MSVVADETAPVGVPAAGADFGGELLDERAVGAGDGHELAPAAHPERLTDALANDVARADEAPAHGSELQLHRELNLTFGRAAGRARRAGDD